MNEMLRANTDIVAELIDKDEAKVSLVLSEETKVIRWDWMNGKYNLTLKHDENSIDLGRAKILKLFYQHDTHGATPPIGRLDNVRLEDGKMKADAYFDKEDEFAMQIFGKIERGFLESVSVGITIHDGKMTEFKSKPNEYTATKWELNEVSIVNIPAIPSAGIELSQEKNTQGEDMNLSDITVDFLQENLPDVVAVFTKQGFEDGKKEGFTSGKEEGLGLGKAEGAKAETERLASIDKVAMAGYEDIVDAAKKDGKSTAEDVELAIIRKQRANISTAGAARSTDGKNLAAQTAELNAGASGGGDEPSDEDKAVALMDEAAQNAKGA